MNYFDFEANWKEFCTHLHSPQITRILKKNDLAHPLWKHERCDYIHAMIMNMANEDPEWKALHLRCEEEQNIAFDKIFEKYCKPDLIHVNIPTGRCHQLAPALFKIAQIMYPSKQWIKINGDKHSTVYCPTDKILFDLLTWFYHRSDKKKVSAEQIFQNALGRKVANQSDTTLLNTRFTSAYYWPKSIKLAPKEDCPICCEPFKTWHQPLPCNHWVHKLCIQKTAEKLNEDRKISGHPLLRKCFCPLCRQTFPTIRPRTSAQIPKEEKYAILDDSQIVIIFKSFINSKFAHTLFDHIGMFITYSYPKKYHPNFVRGAAMYWKSKLVEQPTYDNYMKKAQDFLTQKREEQGITKEESERLIPEIKGDLLGYAGRVSILMDQISSSFEKILYKCVFDYLLDIYFDRDLEFVKQAAIHSLKYMKPCVADYYQAYSEAHYLVHGH